MSGLTHLGADGRPHMVDVSEKPATVRTAEARGEVRCSAEAMALVLSGEAPKGSVVVTAEIAGVMAGKRTAELIPLCHPIPISSLQVRIACLDGPPRFEVTSEARTTGATGIEMEALTAVSVACLTLYDMLKAVDRSMVIGEIRLVSKVGGRSGDWREEVS